MWRRSRSVRMVATSCCWALAMSCSFFVVTSPFMRLHQRTIPVRSSHPSIGCSACRGRGRPRHQKWRPGWPQLVQGEDTTALHSECVTWHSNCSALWSRGHGYFGKGSAHQGTRFGKRAQRKGQARIFLLSRAYVSNLDHSHSSSLLDCCSGFVRPVDKEHDKCLAYHSVTCCALLYGCHTGTNRREALCHEHQG